MEPESSNAKAHYTFIDFQKLVSKAPDIQGDTVKVWTIRQDDTIRINFVEMLGELALHKHPDAAHSLMLIEGRVRVQIGNEQLVMEKGDFISIPANVPHKYWSLTEKSKLVSMDAPYYNPKKTINLE